MADKPLVAIIMGSDSDYEVMQEAAQVLHQMNVAYELTIVSAHRTPQRMFAYAQQAHKRGIRVIIAGAGGAAHLPGMVASLTHLPVIGVPIHSKALSGVDSLYSIVQMPAGVPVATVAINGAYNAGLLAVQILATHHQALENKIVAHRTAVQEEVERKAARLERTHAARRKKQK